MTYKWILTGIFIKNIVVLMAIRNMAIFWTEANNGEIYSKSKHALFYGQINYLKFI